MQDLQAYIQQADLTGDLVWVAGVCGIDVAKKLLLECRGVNIYVPSGLPKTVMQRYAQDARKEGISIKQIARVLRVSERYAQILLQPKAEADAQQLSLLTDSDV